MSERNRVLWRCRRGTLELDLILARFVERHYGRLEPEQRRQFGDLLALPDPELWDLVSRDETPGEGDEVAPLLRLLRQC